MKKFSIFNSKFLILLVAALFAMNSCDQLKEALEEMTLSVEPGNLPVQAASGTYSFAVTSNSAWGAIVETAATWCRVSPTAGNGDVTGTITVDANTKFDPRTAMIAFVAGTLTKTVAVTQAEASRELSIDKATISATAAADSYTIVVTSNATWSATVEPAGSWCSLSPASATGNGTVTVNVAENQEIETRAATITFSAGLASQTVVVTQAEASHEL
jgi:hypothetical protein